MTETSTELALRGPAMADKIEYCKLLADSGLLPDSYRRQPANILYAVEYGETIGIGTMAAITGVHVIKGKPTASAALISALVRRAGHKLRVGYNAAAMVGWAEIVRSDDPDFTFRSEWDLPRAVEAELCQVRNGKPYAVSTKGETLPWQKFYPSMVKARAITEVARDACEEVLFGLHYTPEELGAQVDDDGIPLSQEGPRLQHGVADAVARKAQREATGAEDPWVDNGVALPDDQPKPSTHGQRTKLVILVKQKRGMVTDDGQRQVLSELVGRQLASRKDLTFGEAHRAIDTLEAEPDHIPDAEVVDEPVASEPNPRNGDAPVSAGVEAALSTRSPEDAAARVADSDQLAADWAVAINAAETHASLDSIGRIISAAVQNGRLLEADRLTLEDLWRQRKKELPPQQPPAEPDGDGWSHRALAETTGATL